MTIAEDEKIDWFTIITELRNSHGYSNRYIAVEVCVSVSTVQAWLMGHRPRFEEGARLLALWGTFNEGADPPTVKTHSHRA